MVEYQRINNKMMASVASEPNQSTTTTKGSKKQLNSVLLTLLLLALSCPYYSHVNCDATISSNNNQTTTHYIQRQLYTTTIYNGRLSSPPSPEDSEKEAAATTIVGWPQNSNLHRNHDQQSSSSNNSNSSNSSNSSSNGSNGGPNMGPSTYASARTDKNDSNNFTKSVSVQPLGLPDRQQATKTTASLEGYNNGNDIGTTVLFTTTSIGELQDQQHHKNNKRNQQLSNQTRNKRSDSVHLARDKLMPLLLDSADSSDNHDHQTIRDKRQAIVHQLRQYPNIRKMSNNRNKSSKVTTTTTTTTTTTSTTTTLMPSTTSKLLGNDDNSTQEYEYEEYEEAANDTVSSPVANDQPVSGQSVELPAADNKQAKLNSSSKQASKQDNNINNDNSNNVGPNRPKLWKQKFASDKSRLSVSKDTQQQQQQQQQLAVESKGAGAIVATKEVTNNSNYAPETDIKKKKKARLVQLPFIRAKNESICIAPAYLEFPHDIIGDKWRSRGLIIIHMAVVVYMFYALALVCERYFMPSLEEFSQRLNLSDDVAGATLMSAGSSAPELFTAILGVFIAKGDVGTGAIVGSAVFNILFVIGICSFVTTTVSHLNWWPVLRDSVFYTFTVLVLILFIYDERVSAWESLAMLALYGLYITIMIHNEQIKERVTKFLLTTPLTSKLISAGSIDGADDVFSFNVSLMGNKSNYSNNNNSNNDNNNNNNNNNNTIQQLQQTMDPIMMDDYMFRAALLVIIQHKRLFSCKLRFRSAIQFVIWQRQYKEVKRKRHQRHLQQQQSIEASYIGPEGEDDERERVIRGGSNSYGLKQLHKTAQQLAQQQQQSKQVVGGQGGGSIGSGTVHNNYGTGQMQQQQNITGSGGGTQSISSGQQQRIARYATQSTVSKSKFSLVAEEDLEMWHNPPAQDRGRLDYYVWLAKIPCNFVLYHTIPDCTLYPDKYWLTFIISITWTAIFSYVMVWMVTLIGFTLGIPDSIMGITFLAAGTSVPDAYSSIHVARMGMADMAVSNSIGSNIFDILIGLSLPWFIQAAIYPGVVATINSRGVIYSVILLFLSLVATIYLFNRYNWTLQPRLGLALLMTYCLFLVLTCMLEFNMFGHVNPPPCL